MSTPSPWLVGRALAVGGVAAASKFGALFKAGGGAKLLAFVAAGGVATGAAAVSANNTTQPKAAELAAGAKR